jgi:signal peptidase I
VLVVLTSLTGVVWLADSLLFRQKRMDRSVQHSTEQPREPVLVEYSRSLFPVLLIVLVFRSFLFEPFKIPSGSMIPTLLVGDFIVVNKFSYGIRIPVLNKKIIEIAEPKRGDVVVFRYPINGEKIDVTSAGRFESDQIKCTTPAVDAGLFDVQLAEVNHKILVHGDSRGRNGQWVVPEGHYFMMGDNRDRSNDSREWGFVPEENLLGRAVGVWLNFDFEKGCADFSRIGNGIH